MTEPVTERHTVHISDDTGRVAMWEHRTVGEQEDDNDTNDTLVRYIYSNHLQSASLELDEDGTVISYEEYHPYGTTSFQANNAEVQASAKRYRYTGKERDDESGLYYHGARYYIPWLGRWTAVDPLEAKYAGWSPYHYVKCNPVMDTDSTGMGGDNDLQGSVPKAVKNGGVAGGFVNSSGIPSSARSIVLDEVKVKEYKDRGPGEYHYKMSISNDGTANLELVSFRNVNHHSFLGLFSWDTKIDSKRFVVDFNLLDQGTKKYYIGFPQYGKGYANAWKAEQFENDYLKNSGSATEFPSNYADENGSYAASTAYYAINAQNQMMEAAIPMAEGINRSPRIAFGKNLNLEWKEILRPFASKRNAMSYHNFGEIPGYSNQNFATFEPGFEYVLNHIQKKNGSIHFNLDGVNVEYALRIPKNTKLYDQAHNGLSLWELNKTTEWEFNRIVNNPDMLKRSTFYKMGIAVPYQTLFKVYK